MTSSIDTISFRWYSVTDYGREEKGEKMSKKIVLSCERCGTRNYSLPRPKNQGSVRLELQKFCSHCNARTLHKESV